MKRTLGMVSGFILFVLPASAGATPSGLNNIPTADVVPEKVLVWQAIVDVAEDSKPDRTTGFKYGLFKNGEVGLDGRVFPEAGKEETLKAQIKYRLEINEQAAVALGVANLGDRARLGWENDYAALSVDAGLFRIHLGGTLQRDNEGGFAGLDKTFSVLDRDLTLRTDVIQTHDGHDVTNSVGFIYDLGHNVLIESWVSFPTPSGREDTVTIKLNDMIPF